MSAHYSYKAARRVLAAFVEAGSHRLTTDGIGRRTGSRAVATEVSSLRDYARSLMDCGRLEPGAPHVRCRYDGVTSSGRKVYLYTISEALFDFGDRNS